MFLLPAVASTHRKPLLNVVHCCDALTLLRGLSDGCIDMVVTSPPYNMGTQLNGAKPCSKSTKNWGHTPLLSEGYEDFDDAMPYPEYVEWQRDMLTECMRVVKPAGAIFYNHKWRIQGGVLENRASVVDGFPVRQIIIWDRCSGNNHNDAFFTPQYEVIYMIAKPGFMVRKEANYGDVWRVRFETNTPHPAPFPVEIPKRCILAACPPGGVVLDPFMGSGSTAVAATQNNRNYIGCDVSSKYVEQARARLAQPYMIPLFRETQAEVAPGLIQKSMFAEMSV